MKPQAVSRYPPARSYEELPKGSLWIGNLAGTSRKLFLNEDDLGYHTLISGATGAGKSVAAMVMAEEALAKSVSILVLDPTAQWSGCLKPCEDRHVLRRYPDFGLRENQARSLRGSLQLVDGPDVRVPWQALSPGEVSVLLLHKLPAPQLEAAARSLLSDLASPPWGFSRSLRLLVVFDEFHRITPRLGGGGKALEILEKSLREFRRKSIGVVLVSQLASDFTEGLRSQAMVTLQMHTKSPGDLEQLTQDFGEQTARMVAQLEVGTGMLHDPEYNRGRPIYVSIRPPYHNPHRLKEGEIALVQELEARLRALQARMAGSDEFLQAQERLKEGQLRMAQARIERLESRGPVS